MATNSVVTHAIDKLCTICQVILKDTQSSHSIFSTLEEFPVFLLLDVLQSFSNFNFYNGDKMVCTTCYRKTIQTVKFIKMCNTAYENMKQYYLKHNEEMTTRNDSNSDCDLRAEVETIELRDDRREAKPFHETDEVCAGSSNTHTLVHSGDPHNEVKVKTHICEQCDLRFTQASNLRTHIKTIHAGVKAHKCKQCDRQFTQAAHLRRHMNIHNGVKPYKCDQCDRRFTRATDLRTHMNRHNGVKPHKCEQCDRRFTLASDRRRHMKIHNGHQPPPAPPSNQSTPSANTPCRDNLPPPQPSNGITAYLIRQTSGSRSNSPHSHQGTAEPIQDLPPPPPVSKQASRPPIPPRPKHLLPPLKKRVIQKAPPMVDLRNGLLRGIRDSIVLRKGQMIEQKEVERGNGLHNAMNGITAHLIRQTSGSRSNSPHSHQGTPEPIQDLPPPPHVPKQASPPKQSTSVQAPPPPPRPPVPLPRAIYYKNKK